MQTHDRRYRRYAINDSAADWSTAEAQVARLAKDSKSSAGRSSVVSIKTSTQAGQKRKAGEDENKEEISGEKKKTRRGTGKKAKSQ